tara:strand:- start:682 stop:915 length:234 start_codon:yes stop_codon:yes gene_type:complete
VAALTNFRIGTLVRWKAGKSGEPDDVDELGIVTRLPGENWGDNYHIVWSINSCTSHHSPDMIEEALFCGQMEVISSG